MKPLRGRFRPNQGQMKRHKQTVTVRKVTFVETDPLDMEYRAKALYELFEKVIQRRRGEVEAAGLLESPLIKETRLRRDREYECLFEIDRRLDRIEYNLKGVIELLELLVENGGKYLR